MLYFDEAGYTGPDLTNVQQPYFTMASVCITDEDVELIKADIEYAKWGTELHFANMYTNPQGRAVLNKLFAHPLMDNKHIRLAYANKRYCIYAQIVNTLIETFYHELGVNIYEGAGNLVMANQMYYCAILHPNQPLVNEFESNFVKMVRNSTVEAVADFYRTTDKLRADKDTSEMFLDVLSEIPLTMIIIRETLHNESFYLDLTVPLFSESIQKWYQSTGNKHDILFDSSEPFFANLGLMQSLRDMEHEETLVGYGENKHVYPLPVGNMELAKSHENFGIQIADVYASALNFILTPRTDKFIKYQESVKGLPIFQEVEINIAPASADFLEKRMKDVDGIDPLDFICKNLKR